MKNKKGYFFSIDALIALVIILGVVIFIKPHSEPVEYETYLQEDILDVLSNLKIGEINNSYAENLISSGEITNTNQSVLEQLGEFYANSNPEAQALAQNILNELDVNGNLGIYFDETEIASVGSAAYASAKKIKTSRYLISGVQNASNSTGYSARAYLDSENKIEYFYFGGYIGDGNITAKVTGDLIGAKIEGVFSGDFNLYINNQFVNFYSPTSNAPYEIDLSAHTDKFIDGNNYFNFTSNESLYIAGGFVKATFNATSTAIQSRRKNLAGIDGLINLYDSFYIPGNLTGMNISLHYNSSYNIFLTIGNETIYTANSSGNELTYTIPNSTLATTFNNFQYMNEVTVPIRLGLENASYLLSEQKFTDVVSVTDLSKSMDCSTTVENWLCYYDQGWCESGTCNDGVWEEPIDGAKTANSFFINSMLNTSGNKVGLVGYSDDVVSGNTHVLSEDNESLITEVNSWNPSGGTCICCGINYAKDMLLDQSNDTRNRVIVIMSDGTPNYACSNFNDYDGSSTSTTVGAQDAIDAACNAYDNYGIIVHTVGFGDGANRTILENIANCGGGDSYFGTVDDIIEAYENVSNTIIEASYSEQTISASGIYTKLYPDSYISFTYEKKSVPPGETIITAETNDFGAGSNGVGLLNLPTNDSAYEVRAISYSGSKWTSRVSVNNSYSPVWQQIYNLGDYNTDFVNLGDPYAVNIPISSLYEGDNYINVSIGVSTTNYSAGSQYDKIIYSIVKNITSYSPVTSSANGCTWHIEFEDSTEYAINTPSGYSGSDECYFNSSISGDHAIYNTNDAIEHAIFLLLQSLDLNDNGMIEIKFYEEELSLSSTELAGIPFTWETEIQARTWR